jgi:hypothetical protein
MERVLDWYFWLPIVLGGAIGLIVSVGANLATPHVWGYLTKRKAARIENTKKKASDTYLQLLDLHSGRTDKYLYFLSIALRAMVSLLGVIFTTVAAGMMVIIDEFHIESSTALIDQCAEFVFGLGTRYFLYRANLRLKHLSEWRWRLDNFEKYASDFKKQYGEPPKPTLTD